MSDLDDLRNCLLNLLQMGLLQIRAFSDRDLAERCFIEADHLHNLPEIIRNPRLELVAYYYEVERPAFIKKVGNVEQYREEWDRLKMILDRKRVESVE